MNTFLISLAVLAALVVNALTMYVLSWIISEKINIRIKPFSCWPCLSFWLTCAGGVAIAFCMKRGVILPSVQSQQLARLIVVYAASFLGLANYLYIKNKYKIYE